MGEEAPEFAPAVGSEQLLQAFTVIDEQLTAGGPATPLLLLRKRLIGELVGDGDQVASTLAPAFELVMRTGGEATTTTGRAMVEGIRRGGHAGVVIWVEFDDLLASTERIAGQGTMGTIVPVDEDTVTVATTPFAMFIRLADELMTSEVVFVDSTERSTTTVPRSSLPARAELLAAVVSTSTDG